VFESMSAGVCSHLGFRCKPTRFAAGPNMD
jgi:hypothetical protein